MDYGIVGQENTTITYPVTTDDVQDYLEAAIKGKWESEANLDKMIAEGVDVSSSKFIKWHMAQLRAKFARDGAEEIRLFPIQ